MKYRCPVCGYPSLPYPPSDYHICPCCSTEFANDDADYSHQQLREMWVAGGALWFFGRAPEHWNPWTQLLSAGFSTELPVEFWSVSIRSYAVTDIAEIEKFADTYYLLSGQENFYRVQAAA